MTEVACWAHARRKFYEATDSARVGATHALNMIGQLYGLERKAAKLDAAPDGYSVAPRTTAIVSRSLHHSDVVSIMNRSYLTPNQFEAIRLRLPSDLLAWSSGRSRPSKLTYEDLKLLRREAVTLSLSNEQLGKTSVAFPNFVGAFGVAVVII